MDINHFSRRRFLQAVFYSGLLYGGGALPRTMNAALAAPAPLSNRILVNLMLDGGPDMRHLLVPAWDASPDSFGNKYWNHRGRAHQLSATGVSAEQRWNDDYYPITVGDATWTSSGLVDATGVNSGITFGIWHEAGWLIDMFRAGHVALIFNAVGGANRAHDLSTLMLHQGNVLSSLNDGDRSGWGGRLARSAGGKSLALSGSPSSFSFGPLGAAPGYDPDAIDNVDLIAVENSREIGLFDFDLASNQIGNRDHIMARAAKSYYGGLRQEVVANVYEKFMDHESTVREFGELISGRLLTVPVPPLIQALYSEVAGINPDPNNAADTERRVLQRTSFGQQIRNLYDVIVANDLLNPRVMSLSYGSWDSHGGQRQVPGILATDPHNPYQYRGIESGLKDIFGGQFGVSPSNSAALHGGFSALWASLPSQADRDNMVVTIAGEFGRQIRDNGDSGTDHGKGNLMLVISEQCTGGVYGEIFPDSEVDKYDNTSLNSPDIDPRTEIDEFFSQVCDWVQPNSGATVFPRTDPGYAGTPPIIESAGMFTTLLS